MLIHKQGVSCTTDDESAAVFVTADRIDTDYPYLTFECETDEASPIPYKRIVGHFNNTDVHFAIYLPPKSQWRSRFFQLMYPSQTSTADDNTIYFNVQSGGYTVQASGFIGYRADAAAAKVSRQVAS